jgi:lysophospholipase L1-like esterase
MTSCLLIVLILAGCQIKKVELGDGRQPPATVVVLGSSTAAGTGPKEISNAWVNRYLIWAEDQDSQNRVINLAKGGYTTYHMMPRDYSPPEGRPKPDPCRCITMALSLEPTAIVINMPSNDAAYGYSVDEQLNNYDEILSVAGEFNVPVWITTTQPRNLTQEGRDNLMAMRDSTHSRFAEKAIDFWTGLAQPDGRIDSAFNSGDGVHLNDAGHEMLFRRVMDADVVSPGINDADEEKTSQ